MILIDKNESYDKSNNRIKKFKFSNNFWLNKLTKKIHEIL